MKFAILSIPHTGTHFVNHLLTGELGVNIGEENNKYISHIYQLGVFEKVTVGGYTIVCPMRHPLTTLDSWAKWAKKHPETYNTKVVNLNAVPRLYKNMILADQLYDINFIPVDSPYRDDFLRRFNRRYGFDLITEWRPLNSIGDAKVAAPPEIVGEMVRVMADNRDFFSKFYTD